VPAIKLDNENIGGHLTPLHKTHRIHMLSFIDVSPAISEP